MARTQAADYDLRRSGILDNAAQLFAQSGFDGTSVAQLAIACDTSKSLIYHYYPSKEDILHGVIASHIDQLVEDVDVVMEAGGTPSEVLERLIHAFMAHYVGAADRQKVLLNELHNLPPAQRTAIVDKQRRIVDTVQGLLTSLNPGLAADPAAARVRTMLLFGMINWTHTWFDPAGPVAPRRVADMVLDLIDPRQTPHGGA